MRAKKLRTKVVGIVQTPRAGLFVPPYFIHFFKERGVCYEKIFKDFYFP